MKIVLFLFAIVFSVQAFSQPLPLDPAIRMGKLPNGFTYYIRKNTEPENRVQLYLVNKVVPFWKTKISGVLRILWNI